MPFPSLTLNDGNKIPSIAFGSGAAYKGRDVSAYTQQALKAGFSHVDTAQGYLNEDSVGQGIHESGRSRDEVYVTTKWSGSGEVQDAIHSSLSALRLEYLDLYLIHSPIFFPGNEELELCWRNFEKAKEAGLARSIGVSNFNLSQLQFLLKVAHIKPAVHQISLNPYNYEDMKPLLEYHAKHDIVTEAYSSLAPITALPGGPLDPVLDKIAKKRKIAPSQVLFLWVRAKGAVIVTTTSRKERLKEYIDVGELEDLNDEEIRSIEEAASKLILSSSAGNTRAGLLAPHSV